jgi:hypothetical protein
VSRSDADGWRCQVDDAPEKVEEVIAHGFAEQRIGVVEKAASSRPNPSASGTSAPAE